LSLLIYFNRRDGGRRRDHFSIVSNSSLRCDQISFTKLGWQRRNDVKPIETKYHLALGWCVFCRNAFSWQARFLVDHEAGQGRQFVLIAIECDMSELAGKYAGPLVAELVREYSIGENLPIVSRRNQNLPDLKSSPFISLLDAEALSMQDPSFDKRVPEARPRP
jgi:hypothetical protein